MKLAALKEHLHRWTNATIVFAIVAAFVCPPWVQLYAQTATGSECGMKCCKGKPSSCCRRAKKSNGAGTTIREASACAGKCSRLPAILSKVADGASPAAQMRVFLAQILADDLRSPEPARLQPGFDLRYFQRPPPSV